LPPCLLPTYNRNSHLFSMQLYDRKVHFS
jgi:hypothetical protein